MNGKQGKSLMKYIELGIYIYIYIFQKENILKISGCPSN